MSELTDKIAEFQRRTGESVLESKRYLDLASGDLELALSIYLDENSEDNAAKVREEKQKEEAREAAVSKRAESNNSLIEKNALRVMKTFKNGAIIMVVQALIVIAVGIGFLVTSKPSDGSPLFYLGIGFVVGGTFELCFYPYFSYRRYIAMQKVIKECNVSPGIALQALNVTKWKVDAAIKELKDNPPQ